MPAINVIAMILLIVGGLNWGLVGLFNFDLVAALFGGTVGTYSTLSRVIFTIVGIAALYGFALLAPLSGTTTADMRSRRNI
jgi:uncharacterized membrane protein YuzA (DUF378 family)